MSPITVIKLKRSNNMLYIDRALDAFDIVYNKSITLAAHEIQEDKDKHGIYCLFMYTLAEIEGMYRNSEYIDSMSFGEWIYHFANVKVEK